MGSPGFGRIGWFGLSMEMTVHALRERLLMSAPIMWLGAKGARLFELQIEVEAP
jgi:hypothetical protein